MVHQFGKQLPRPVQVWVLDTVPGDVWCEAGDHPRDTINHARTIPMPIPTRKHLVDSLVGAGFTLPGAQWMTTNLTPAPPPRRTASSRGRSTSRASSTCTRATRRRTCGRCSRRSRAGLEVDFVRAETSAFVWTPEDVARIEAHGARVHFLPNSSHWVHIDNPEGLLGDPRAQLRRVRGDGRRKRG